MDLTPEQQQMILDRLEAISKNLDSILKTGDVRDIKESKNALKTNRDRHIDIDGKLIDSARDSDEGSEQPTAEAATAGN